MVPAPAQSHNGCRTDNRPKSARRPDRPVISPANRVRRKCRRATPSTRRYIHAADALGCGDVDGPVASAAYIGLAAFFERLERSDFVALVVNLAAGCAHQF